MNRMLKISAAALAALAMLVVLPATMQAQNPDLSGSWGFNADKSELPQAPGGAGGRGGGRMMGGGDMVIATEGNTISITTTRQGRDGPTQQTTSYVCDGEEHEINTGRGTSTYTAEWKDGSLVITNTRSMGDRGNFTTTETYTLTGNGQTLEVTSQMPDFRGGGSPTTMKRVYDKK